MSSSSASSRRQTRASDGAPWQGEHDRQRWIAVAEVDANGLSRLHRVADHVEKIVDDLKRHADRAAAARELLDESALGSGDAGGDARSGLKQGGGLAADDLVIVGDRYCGVAAKRACMISPSVSAMHASDAQRTMVSSKRPQISKALEKRKSPGHEGVGGAELKIGGCPAHCALLRHR